MFGSVFTARGMCPIQPSSCTGEVGGICTATPVAIAKMPKLSRPLANKMQLTLDAHPTPTPAIGPVFVLSAGNLTCAAHAMPNARGRLGLIVTGEQDGNHEGADYKLAS